MPIPGYAAPATADRPAAGPLAGTSVVLGSITFNHVDSNGVEWVLENVDGWDGTDATGDLVPRPLADGSWDAARYLGSKVMTLDGGVITAPDARSLDTAIAELLANLPIRSLVTLTVYQSTPRRCQVKRGTARPNLTRVGDREAIWSCVIEAPDPRRYAVAAQHLSTTLPDVSGGGITPPLTPPLALPAVPKVGTVFAENDGDVDAPWTATVTGPVDSGWALSCGDYTLAFDFAVPVGQQATIDALNGIVLLGGQPYMGRVARGSTWWMVPRRGGADIVFSGTGTGRVDIYVSSTWS